MCSETWIVRSATVHGDTCARRIGVSVAERIERQSVAAVAFECGRACSRVDRELLALCHQLAVTLRRRCGRRAVPDDVDAVLRRAPAVGGRLEDDRRGGAASGHGSIAVEFPDDGRAELVLAALADRELAVGVLHLDEAVRAPAAAVTGWRGLAPGAPITPWSGLDSLCAALVSIVCGPLSLGWRLDAHTRSPRLPQPNRLARSNRQCVGRRMIFRGRRSVMTFGATVPEIPARTCSASPGARGQQT